MNPIRSTILVALICLLAAGVVAQRPQPSFDLSNYGVKIDADKRLIVVLASLEMAVNESGEKVINTPLSEKGANFRTQLLQDTAGLDPDLRRRISQFLIKYKKRRPNATDAELVAPFISMAFTLGPLPEMADPVITSDLPGDLLDVLDFAPLAREFYRRSGISAKLDDYAKMYGREADGVLRTSAREMIGDLLDYLHTKPQLIANEKIKIEAQKTKRTKLEKTEIRTHERHFYIVPEMLAAQGNVNFLNARDDYYVILPPDKDVSFSDVRRAFLQFVIDPIVLGNSKDINAVSAWVKPQLEERRKTDASITPDVFLTVSRSLAAAVDIRQAEYLRSTVATYQARRKIDTLKSDAEKRAVSAELEKFKQSLSDETALKSYEDYEKGLVLTPYFADKLKEIEESGFDIAASLGEMLASFDPAKESGRFAAAADARKRALAAREERKNRPQPVAIVVENPVTARLREIQKTIDAKDYTKAVADLKQLQTQDPSDARIYYNLGRVAALVAVGIEDADAQTEKLIEAKEAYSSVLKTAKPDTDPTLLSLTYVALARIYEHFNQNDQAMALYDKAIKLGPVGAYHDAIAGKQRLLKPN